MLSDSRVRQIKPAPKPLKLFDERGLYLLVSPQGGKWWRFKYMYNGKEKLMSLGVYPEVSLKAARESRDEARRLLSSGIDPCAKRQQEATEKRIGEANSFESVAEQWMALQRVAAVTALKNRWLLNTCLYPELGKRPIDAITPRELLVVLRRIERSGKHETASRAKNKAGQIFRFAILEGLCENDPTSSLRGTLKTPRVIHHAAITEPSKIGELMRAIEGYSGQPSTAFALKLAPYVFVRPGELRRAEWTEFDLERAEWRIPAERMKMRAAHLVPLSKQAVRILRQLWPLTGTGRLLFPSIRSNNRPISENTLNAALRRLGYSHDQMTCHGFRSMAATRLNEMGWRADAIERQLAHVEKNKVRQAYTSAAEFLDERIRMMNAWGKYLEGLRDGAEVIPIRKTN